MTLPSPVVPSVGTCRPSAAPAGGTVRRGWLVCAAILAPAALGAPGAAAQQTATHHRHHHHHAPANAPVPAATAARHHHHAAAPAPHGHHPAPHHAGAIHGGTPPHHHHVIAPRHAALPPAATGVAAGAAAGVAAGTAGPAQAETAIPSPPGPADAAAIDKGTVTGLPLPRFAALRADEVNMRSGPGQRYPIAWVYHRRDLPVKIEREFDVWRLVEDSDGQKGWVHQATLVGARTFVVPGLPPVDPASDAAAQGASAQGAPARSGTAPAGGKPAAPTPQPGPGGHFDTTVVGHLADPAAAATIPGAVILRAAADAASAVVAVLKPGSVGTFRTCAAGTTWCRVSVQHYSGWLDRSSVWGLLPQETIQP
ncbi:protein of unknown function DUF1058 [Gluconacetobacter diazotrophicus PA1 5]|uniref:SH3 domain-containing protein n=1 Tax=Gluconacetobacter diazotrophicus TaxID=33996 RepID=UPI000173AFAE|nr:SH3 domain-containing protein [Gluconacetobacter diazotrophicus]ACI51760.1 protein of unknown function DUF1058 [Gluconacetobacter diazotrophicus PA1 5]TWB11104.1 SH3 domain-containing protein [Gluconacetobacter diazotrophicus]